jgi:hypothetical protein
LTSLRWPPSRLMRMISWGSMVGYALLLDQ